jgi:tetratricopeptide (TPR) repeat protein
LVELKQYEEYGKVTEKALSLDPDCHLAWMNRGLAHYHLGRPWVEVAQCYDKAISLRPDDPVIWEVSSNVVDRAP